MLIKVTPDKEKASSILKMVNSTLEMIKELDSHKYPSNVTKEYYESIRELISVIALLDGFKTQGEGAHKELIDYLKENYHSFNEQEINLVDDLRNKRNRIAYDGFFVNEEYIERNNNLIIKVITKLKTIIKERLTFHFEFLKTSSSKVILLSLLISSFVSM